jgi:tetratricopeptide (TPR) repeat protein
MRATTAYKRGLARARKAWQSGDFAAALAEVDRLLSDWPDQPALLVMRGGLIQLQDEKGPPLAEARAALERAVELDETAPAAWTELGHFLNAVEDDADGAARCFQKAAELARRQLEDALLAQAQLLSDSGHEADALARLSEVLGLPPSRRAAGPREAEILERLKALAQR